MKMKKQYFYLKSMTVTIALTVVLSACDNVEQVSAPAPAPASAPANQNVSQSAAPLAKSPTAIKGKIAETMNVSGYTYIRIDNGSKNEIWAAIPKTELKIGEEVSLQGGTVMRNFSSKSLERTFDSIIFASGVIRGDGGKTMTTGGGSASWRGSWRRRNE